MWDTLVPRASLAKTTLPSTCVETHIQLRLRKSSLFKGHQKNLKHPQLCPFPKDSREIGDNFPPQSLLHPLPSSLFPPPSPPTSTSLPLRQVFQIKIHYKLIFALLFVQDTFWSRKFIYSCRNACLRKGGF